MDGDEVDLTHREYELAVFLFRSAGRVVSRDHILESIWGMHGQQLNTRTVDTHVSRLRKKLAIGEGKRLETDGHLPAWLPTGEHESD